LDLLPKEKNEFQKRAMNPLKKSNFNIKRKALSEKQMKNDTIRKKRTAALITNH